MGSYNPDPLNSKASATLAPKPADPPFWWKSLTLPPLNLDPVYLIQIVAFIVLFRDVCY
jgi:hypothetical protein